MSLRAQKYATNENQDDCLPKYYGSSTKGKASGENKKQIMPIESSHFTAVLVATIVLFAIVIVIEKKLPPGLTINEEKEHPDRFIAERAMNNLIGLTKLGPRVAGSHENEVEAVNYLTNLIEDIIKTSQDIHVIEYDVFKSSGAFTLDFLDGFTNVYRDVQSVVVKIGSRINSPHSLLINCHFDSVADSPGASDDGAACAVMLEMFRVLSKSKKLLRHNVIFLFNGAEENIMQASHGFVTNHKWAKEIKAFINLEACGAGGRELLFQAGPNNPWILETYSEMVPYPYASSLAQEIFESGIIPGETDYRIFRDFGNASGVDFAWSTNGYVYHTLFDTVNNIPLGSLQRTGDNILALARGMANGYQMDDIEKYREGNLVFFDFLGAFVVRWSEYVSNFINISTFLFAIFTMYKNYSVLSKELNGATYVKYVFTSSGFLFLSWLTAIITVVFVALSLSGVGRTMSWFSRPVWLLFIYIIPTMCSSMVVLLITARKYFKSLYSPWTVFQFYYDGCLLIWAISLLCCIVMKFRSGFIPLLWVSFLSLGNYLQHFIFRRWKNWKWILYHVAIVFVPFTQSFYLLLGAFNLFVPIMGRTGAGNNSELMIAVMVGLFFGLLYSFISPLVVLVRHPERILSLIMGLFHVSMGILILTPLGFPYSGDVTAPAPQRFMVLHTNKTFVDFAGVTRRSETGYWFVDLDINSPYSISHQVPEILRAEPVIDDCDNEIYCGLPYLLPVRHFIWKTHWMSAPAPIIPMPTNFQVTSKEKINDTILRISVNVTGPDHMGIMLSPLPNINLISWTIVDGKPLKGEHWNGRESYFIYYAYAAKPKPLSFSMDFKVSKNHTNEPTLDIAVSGHFMHGPNQTSETFKKFLGQFPKWTAITAWTATFTSYRI